MERSELTADELVLPSSRLPKSFMGFLELSKLMVGKRNQFSDASNREAAADDWAEQWQTGPNDSERRFHHWPVHGWGKQIFSLMGQSMA